MDYKLALSTLLFSDLANKYFTGDPISETEFKLMIETMKSKHDDSIDNSNLKTCDKAKMKILYEKLADSIQEYALEALRTENKLVK